jgi:hypothetical protein
MMWWRRLQSWRDEKFILDQLKAALKEEYYNFVNRAGFAGGSNS